MSCSLSTAYICRVRPLASPFSGGGLRGLMSCATNEYIPEDPSVTSRPENQQISGSQIIEIASLEETTMDHMDHSCSFLTFAFPFFSLRYQNLFLWSRPVICLCLLKDSPKVAQFLKEPFGTAAGRRRTTGVCRTSVELRAIGLRQTRWIQSRLCLLIGLPNNYMYTRYCEEQLMWQVRKEWRHSPATNTSLLHTASDIFL